MTQRHLPATLDEVRQKVIGILTMLIGAVGVFLSGFITYRSFAPSAAEAPLETVRINPESIVSPLGGTNVNLSALAYDSGGNPVWSGVSYQWGMSAMYSIGKFFPNNNDKLATFEPSKTTSGIGDIWVQAFGLGGTTVRRSIPVYVGVTPTPTPTTSPTPTNTPTPNPSTTPSPTSTPPPTPTNTPTPTPTPTPSPTPIPTATPTPTPISCNKADINKDGVVDWADISILFENFFSWTPTNPRADINGDGIVDMTDYSILVTQYNVRTGPCI